MASVGSLYNTNISLTYDEAGRAVNRTYYSSGNGLQTNFDYYDWSEQVSTVPQGGLLSSSQTGTLADADSLVSLAYIYDAVGNVASITDLVQTPAQTQIFGYDSLYRLESATGSAGFGGAYSEAYTYDSQGRMDSKAGDTLSYSATRTGTCQANSLTPAASSTITHAVSSKSGGNTYTYDCNGNAIARGDQTLIYDEENRLVEVQEGGDVVGSYVYDGDGNRVMSTGTVGNTTTTTLYVGAYYEKVNTRVYQNKNRYTDTLGWKKYYYAGSVRLAMREDSDDPLYLIGDHLGSTSLVLDTAGLEVAKQTYLPFGEEWGVSATELPTTFTYTGQREAAEIGLMYYVARWYDSEIGHFIQADTIVPGAGNPLAWNRFGYVFYNPIKYTDPSGHWSCGDYYDAACAETGSELAQVYQNQGLIDSGFDASIVPDWIPTRDPDLFVAYVFLYTQTEDIPYGYGGQFTTSGYELGMTTAENQIEIIFDDSCASACVEPGIPLVKIAASRKGDDSVMEFVRSISHEAFHKTDPFKHGNNSMYEELWARHVSGVVSNYPRAMIPQTDLDNALDSTVLDQALAKTYGYDYNPYKGKVELYYPSPAYYFLAQYYFTESSPMRDR